MNETSLLGYVLHSQAKLQYNREMPNMWLCHKV